MKNLAVLFLMLPALLLFLLLRSFFVKKDHYS